MKLLGYDTESLPTNVTRFFIRNLAQGLVPTVPYFWTSNSQTVVLKVP